MANLSREVRHTEAGVRHLRAAAHLLALAYTEFGSTDDSSQSPVTVADYRWTDSVRATVDKLVDKIETQLDNYIETA